MLETEAAECLMSLSAPDERKFDGNPLYAQSSPWSIPSKPSQSQSHGLSGSLSSSASNKRSFHSFSEAGAMSHSLPTPSFMQHRPPPSSSYQPFSLLRHDIKERPLTSMIPGRSRREYDDDSDIDMDSDEDDDDRMDQRGSNQRRGSMGAFRSPLDGLVAAADATNQDDNDFYYHSSGTASSSSSSSPIAIPMRRSTQQHQMPHPSPHRMDFGRSSLTRVKEEGGASSSEFRGLEFSPTGVEDDNNWMDSYKQTNEYRQRARMASICSSEGSEYGGLGRKHLEEFIRMEISAANDKSGESPPSDSARYIGSYSPEARRKRIERFLEKRKRRVWAKKVDYDVRKNFANSRLRVKGRFVKKEDEELLCQMMSFT